MLELYLPQQQGKGYYNLCGGSRQDKIGDVKDAWKQLSQEPHKGSGIGYTGPNGSQVYISNIYDGELTHEMEDCYGRRSITQRIIEGFDENGNPVKQKIVRVDDKKGTREYLFEICNNKFSKYIKSNDDYKCVFTKNLKIHNFIKTIKNLLK